MKKPAFLQVYIYFDKKKFLKVARLVLLSIHKLSFFFESTVNINIQCRCLDCV